MQQHTASRVFPFFLIFFFIYTLFSDLLFYFIFYYYHYFSFINIIIIIICYNFPGILQDVMSHVEVIDFEILFASANSGHLNCLHYLLQKYGRRGTNERGKEKE